MPGFAGLRTDVTTWVIMAGLTLCWMISVRLVPGWRQDGWRSLLKSVFGLVWFSFGLDIVLRFSMLAYNAVAWGNGTPRLVALTSDIVNRTLAYSWLFWVMVAVSYSVGVRRRSAGVLRVVRNITPDVAYGAAIPFALVSSVLFYLTAVPDRLPLAVLTPLSLIASFYMVPATIVWWDHFRRPGPKWRIGSVHVIVLLPALVHGVCSPYRENLAPIFSDPLVCGDLCRTASFAGQASGGRIGDSPVVDHRGRFLPAYQVAECASAGSGAGVQ